MIFVQLNDTEKKVLEDLLQKEIKRLEKIGGDPFHTADIVNIFRQLQHPLKDEKLVAQYHSTAGVTYMTRKDGEKILHQQYFKDHEKEIRDVMPASLPIEDDVDALLEDDIHGENEAKLVK